MTVMSWLRFTVSLWLLRITAKIAGWLLLLLVAVAVWPVTLVMVAGSVAAWWHGWPPSRLRRAAVGSAIYRRAADLIREHGHDSRPEGSRWELTSPHSICSASDATAISARPDKIDAEDLGEEAHIRTLMADDCEKISVIGENSRQAVKTASDLLRTLSVTPDREKP